MLFKALWKSWLPHRTDSSVKCSSWDETPFQNGSAIDLEWSTATTSRWLSIIGRGWICWFFSSAYVRAARVTFVQFLFNHNRFNDESMRCDLIGNTSKFNGGNLKNGTWQEGICLNKISHLMSFSGCMLIFGMVHEMPVESQSVTQGELCCQARCSAQQNWMTSPNHMYIYNMMIIQIYTNIVPWPIGHGIIGFTVSVVPDPSSANGGGARSSTPVLDT